MGGGRVLSPALAVESVAAGGGSVCAFGAQGLRVGPESAGASPGPACYGAGGPLTVTDVNLLLGRLDPARFGIPVDPAPAEAALEALRRELRERTGEDAGREPLLAGFLEIADERMADAIRGISLRRGYDPAEHALVAFGGAGGQHACGVAARLGIRTVLVPPDAGLLSALGIGHAPLERFAERQVLLPLDEAGPRLAGWMDEMAAEAAAAVAREGVPPDEVAVRRRIAGLRYAGQDATLTVDWSPGLDLRDAFEERYAALYGHRPERRPVELESLRVVASTRPAEADPLPAPDAYQPEPDASARAWLGGAWRDAPVFDRAALRPGARLAGPALVVERHSATVVEAGWDTEVDGSAGLVIRQCESASCESAKVKGHEPSHSRAFALSHSRTPEAVRLELFTHRFRALVGEMGEQLRRTALSVNVKERLDFSCALLDPRGELVVNAPHIPVHLGALGLCVRTVREAVEMEPGDVVVTNHPGFGGSHLPDVTTVTPVHDGGGRLLGYVASRAHHAEIGGSRPGSMPPGATTLAEEGVVIAPTHLVRRGEARWAEMRELLASGPFPSRAVEDNLADLAAAVAANHRGAALLRALAAEHGADTVARYMDGLQARAEKRVREALARIPDGAYEAEERLDDGSPLRVRVEVAGDGARVDFAGTGGVHPGNLNATPAIVRSVVLYVLRLLVDEPLPLNEGLLRAVELNVPRGMLHPEWPEDPARGPAVVGGNTEVSQRLVDTLLGALRLA
ncbi:MAG TPA: hydantoinase B/oxoprolinase family protein, partial [Longimicrobiaceae bacterium]|nr:hydantoinase B/oxoprolinase family protein [Longimicrobiaceae bacterium]